MLLVLMLLQYQLVLQTQLILSVNLLVVLVGYNHYNPPIERMNYYYR
jgi:hypothetical protein